MKENIQKRIILASPILVLIVGNITAHFFTNLLNQWAWMGVEVVYWGCLILIVSIFGGKDRIKRWFQKPQGSYGWFILAIAMGIMAFPMLFIPNIQVLNSLRLVILWFVFAIINSICEEIYWRGFLLDEMGELPGVIGITYSTIIFTAIHPLMLGIFSEIQSFDPKQPLLFLPFGVILVVLSLVYCLIYLKTKSLRWPILSHFLSDLGNLSIFVFMNMIEI